MRLRRIAQPVTLKFKDKPFMEQIFLGVDGMTLEDLVAIARYGATVHLTQNSEIISSHKDCPRIQDACTLRCSPQVHGASKDAINYVFNVLETEMNSSTNNPLFFPESEEFLLGGNFHGQPVAPAMDFLCMAVSELANISERRIERLLNPK